MLTGHFVFFVFLQPKKKVQKIKKKVHKIVIMPEQGSGREAARVEMPNFRPPHPLASHRRSPPPPIGSAASPRIASSPLHPSYLRRSLRPPPLLFCYYLDFLLSPLAPNRSLAIFENISSCAEPVGEGGRRTGRGGEGTFVFYFFMLMYVILTLHGLLAQITREAFTLWIATLGA